LSFDFGNGNGNGYTRRVYRVALAFGVAWRLAVSGTLSAIGGWRLAWCG